MQIITTEISDETIATLNDDADFITDFLHYYGKWEGFNKDNKQYTSAQVSLITNTGIRFVVDNKEVDIMWQWKYAWLLSDKNTSSNVTVAPISDDLVNKLLLYVADAKTATVPAWKTLSKQYYTNGRNGETFNRYNTYTGSKTDF